jgi:hypothetical protein
MKKGYFLIFTVAFFAVVGCNKDASTTNKLLGEWNLVSLKYKNNEGLTRPINCIGTVYFDKDNSTYSTTFQYNSSLPIHGLGTRKGAFLVSEKGKKLLLTDSLSVQSPFITTQIDCITSNDLVLHYYDNSYQMYDYVFKKKR